MSKKKRQLDHALLESWRPPHDAGDPVGCLTTTFTFDAGFFEEECLARFLEIDSLPDREGLAYLLERENRLGPVYAGVLVDYRHAGVDHSLRWDVLPVRVPRGKQHAKITLIAWTNHVRILVASANLTQPGYRYNQEVAGSIELTPTSATKSELTACCDFLVSLASFVPGAAEGDKACDRARAFVERIRHQVEPWQEPRRRGSRLRQNLVFTLPASSQGLVDRQSTLATCLATCRKQGGSPSEAWVSSPFFDVSAANSEDKVTAELSKGMARRVKRRLTLCVPSIGNEEVLRLAAPLSLYQTATNRIDDVSVEVLPSHDGDANTRGWHAKMMALSSRSYYGLLIGSSNFTKAGMGVGPVSNAEANLLYMARREAYAREVGELVNCWPETSPLDDPESAEWAGPMQELDEDEREPKQPPLPAGFVSVQYRAGKQAALLILLSPKDLHGDWRIMAGRKHDELLLDASAHLAQKSPSSVEVSWPYEYAPGKLLVQWDNGQAFWSINVEDESRLPMPSELESMTAEDLLFILAASDSSAAFRTWARGRQGESPFDEEFDSAVPPDLDPLRRYNLQDTFLRRVRRQARLLAAVRQNLERPVWSEHALEWRLKGMIGVEPLVKRLTKKLSAENGRVLETVLTLADILLMLTEVNYQEADGTLSKRKFKRIFKQFLRDIAREADAELRSTGRAIPRDVQQFWTGVYQRCRA